MEGPGEEVGKTGPVEGGVQLGSRMAEQARALCPALGFWMEQRWLDGISGPPQLAGTGLEGWGWRPGGGGGRWRRRHTVRASPASCRGARGNTWLVGRRPGASVTKRAPAAQGHPRPPPTTPSDREETDGTGPAPISMTTPRKQTRRRDPLRTQEVERALPGQNPAVGGHCVPGRAGPILPPGDPGSPRPTPPGRAFTRE